MNDETTNKRKLSVLVAYATKKGATAGIAEKIGETLREEGVEAEVSPAGQANDPERFDAVILGSAVYVGQWRKEAVAFLERHEPVLAARPVWLFSSGPTGQGDPVELMKGWRFPEALQPIAERIKVRDVAFFHGSLDPKGLNLIERLAIKAVKAPIGDCRDWNAIESWAKGIADALRKDG